jgi:hypothetical protein
MQELRKAQDTEPLLKSRRSHNPGPLPATPMKGVHREEEDEGNDNMHISANRTIDQALLHGKSLPKLQRPAVSTIAPVGLRLNYMLSTQKPEKPGANRSSDSINKLLGSEASGATVPALGPERPRRPEALATDGRGTSER